jgi:cytochrome c peroxidase
VHHRVLLAATCLALTFHTSHADPTSTGSSGSASELAFLPGIIRSIEAGEFGASPSDKQRALRGAVNFFSPYPGGNGRSCATCHNPDDGYSLSPATVEARWKQLQRSRLTNPQAVDPLFRSIDADDGREDFTSLRTRALVRVRVPLPERVRLTDTPNATEVEVWRAVPPLNMLEFTAPYQQDRSIATLEAHTRAAVDAHLEPSAPPSQEYIESIAYFERQLFTTAESRRVAAALRAGAPVPEVDPPLNDIERLGKQRFDDFCGQCHGGPAQVENRENRIFPPFDGSTNPRSLNVGVSNPLPQGMKAKVIHGPAFDLPTQRYTIELPAGKSVELTSSDPGTVLTDVHALETVGGNQVFNRFDIPQLRGINRTAPYFHDHRARTLEDVVRHYQEFFLFINTVRGFPLPQIPDQDVEPIVAYMRKAL